ncbi:hypothetical protein JH06_5108 [Blastocystis sp. subtype 4]|uniref:hypothetical protein n=1 Tax=Blastocystis sp. subtype 4 TaxID=944170 RepID=UPI00071145CB|nr:hypothetical protein JH06_5108 [Blastocystis sp. subtype 4]KNB41501.1 hypothetical protein JH06_5108 [Blastocystis sp. subtype 4]|eukprot:XP_014524944.1 hypothetical protein JH06_5108 [Blastocystis sp. subtype 4]
MFRFVLLLVLSVLAFALDCSSNQVYTKITKKTGYYANEESFKIYSGSTEVYTSPSLTNSEERVIEVCLSASTNYQYSLEMTDSYGDSWSDGAWIKFESINGNVVYKAMMTAGSSQTEPLSLYSPINKYETWKYTANASGDWKVYSFDDSTWTDYTAGGEAISGQGTQYFRRQFVGVNSMAAFEMQLNYRYGIVAYINGVEVYRDNMADGTPSSSTPATGSYTTYGYRGLIRPANEVTASSVLAVEVHPVDLTTTVFIQFDGFLSLMAGLSSTNNCFVVPNDMTVTATGFTNPTYAITFTRNTGAYLSTPPGSLTFEISGSIPQINSFRVWPYTSITLSPRSFSIEGAMSTTSSWQTVLSISEQTYESSTWAQWDLVSVLPQYPLIRFNGQSSQSGTVYVYELQFLVCNRAPPTSISYPQNQYSFYSTYEQVSIAPTMYGFYGCSISPALPSGVSMDPDTCTISGTATATSPSTSYLITSTMGTIQLQTSISITFTECAGAFYRILRTYTYSPQYEYFRLRDSSNDNILYEIQSGHTHAANVNWETYLCITVERFDVAFYSTSTYWYSGSYYYMYAMLPDGEEEMVVKGRYDNNQDSISSVTMVL